jgi:hypothetical protein
LPLRGDQPRRWDRFWYIVAASFLAAQLALVLAREPHAPQGDEPWYLGLARHLTESGTFPKADPARLEPAHFRPPGYPVLLSPVIRFFPGDLEGRRVTGIMQFLAISAATVALFAVAHAFVGVSPVWLALAVGVPWTFQWVTVIYPDSFSVAFTAAGSALMLALCSAPASRFAPLFALGGASLLALSLLVRPENVLVASVSIGVAWLLLPHREKWRPAVLASLSLPLVGAVLVLAGYRWTFLGNPGLVGSSYQDRWGGIVRWASTTTMSERQFYEEFIYPFDHGTIRWEQIPPVAFTSPAEKEAIHRLAEQTSEKGYGPEVDKTFGRLAKDRIDANPLKFVLVPRILGLVRSFVNTQTSPQLLDALSRMPRTPRRVLLGIFVGAKALLFSAFLTVLLVVAIATCRTHPSSALTRGIVLLTVPVLARAAAVCLVIGLREQRYMASAWLPLILVVGMGFSLGITVFRRERGRSTQVIA